MSQEEPKNWPRLTSDVAFKRFFKYNEHLLPSLLSNFLPLEKGSVIEGVELLDPESHPPTIAEKTYVLDLRVKIRRKSAKGLQQEETVNVEIQTTARKELADRVLAYLARLYSQQIKQGEDYSQLNPVYSLLFTTENLAQFSSVKKYYHLCRLQRVEHPHLEFSHGMQFVVVELAKFTTGSEKIVDKREAWCYILKQSHDMSQKDCQQVEKQGAEMAGVIKGLWNLSKDEMEMARMEMEEKYRLDRLSEREYAFDQGKAQGMKAGEKQGLQKGLQKGVQKGLQKVALEMLKKGADVSLIQQYTGLTLAEVKKLAKKAKP